MRTASVEDICDHVRRMPSWPRVTVAIDGIDGVGKSTLAREIVQRIGGAVVSVDAYLNMHLGGYVPHVRCDDLRAACAQAAAPIVVEGICIEAVLARCELQANLHIYVRRLAACGRWDDEDVALGMMPEELKRQAEAMRRWSFESEAKTVPEGGIDLGVEGELIDYHAEHQPVARSDIVFDVIEAVVA